ncbi:uncharacterized protein TEOVI_000285200 [Trypanosoma equiperdum]|uniref:Uncharacterized protein n=1 Tax=Trypanosoma equiperdum TaxID=5694 RepID=A0A1G4IG43_TRYEQ|nr:hypothetical protein, conserved [Trypanosoma equiperdum]
MRNFEDRGRHFIGKMCGLFEVAKRQAIEGRGQKVLCRPRSICLRFSERVNANIQTKCVKSASEKNDKQELQLNSQAFTHLIRFYRHQLVFL